MAVEVAKLASSTEKGRPGFSNSVVELSCIIFEWTKLAGMRVVSGAPSDRKTCWGLGLDLSAEVQGLLKLNDSSLPNWPRFSTCTP